MRIPRFQLSVRTLFLLVSLAAVACYACRYAILRKRASEAEDQYLFMRAALDYGTARMNDVIDASTKYLEAELRVPFADRVRAKADYVERIGELERLADGHRHALFGSWEGMKEAEREYDRLRDLREQAEEELRQD